MRSKNYQEERRNREKNGKPHTYRFISSRHAELYDSGKETDLSKLTYEVPTPVREYATMLSAVWIIEKLRIYKNYLYARNFAKSANKIIVVHEFVEESELANVLRDPECKIKYTVREYIHPRELLDFMNNPKVTMYISNIKYLKYDVGGKKIMLEERKEKLKMDILNALIAIRDGFDELIRIVGNTGVDEIDRVAESLKLTIDNKPKAEVKPTVEVVQKKGHRTPKVEITQHAFPASEYLSGNRVKNEYIARQLASHMQRHGSMTSKAIVDWVLRSFPDLPDNWKERVGHHVANLLRNYSHLFERTDRSTYAVRQGARQ